MARVSISSNQGACPAPALGVPGVALHPDGLEAELASRGPLTLHAVQELLGEAVVEPEFCRAVYEIARGLPGAEVIDSICDQLGRAGDGLARIEHAHRIELIFSPDISQLLAYQQFLAEPQPFAPGETLHSWSAFVGRRIVAGLPPRFPRCPGFLAFRPALALAL